MTLLSWFLKSVITVETDRSRLGAELTTVLVFHAPSLRRQR